LRAAELAKMFDLEDTYWWFVARRELVRELLLRYGQQDPDVSILDVGCGTGATLKAVDDLGVAVGIDRSGHALRYCRRRGLTRLAAATAEALPIATGSLDVVLALDLLEHIRDDGAAAKELARVLRPGGLLLVTVPACPALWSEHDEALDHIRRYRGTQLRGILTRAGFHIEKLTPIITLLLLPIAALRLMQRLLPRRRGAPETAFIIPPAPVNWLLTTLLRLERIWLRRFPLPVGVSLVGVARRT
jgi:SAM-dependent methyltransferase